MPYSKFTDLNVNLIQKNTFTETPGIIFDQIFGHSGLAKLTYKINHHNLLLFLFQEENIADIVDNLLIPLLGTLLKSNDFFFHKLLFVTSNPFWPHYLNSNFWFNVGVRIEDMALYFPWWHVLSRTFWPQEVVQDSTENSIISHCAKVDSLGVTVECTQNSHTQITAYLDASVLIVSLTWAMTVWLANLLQVAKLGKNKGCQTNSRYSALPSHPSPSWFNSHLVSLAR